LRNELDGEKIRGQKRGGPLQLAGGSPEHREDSGLVRKKSVAKGQNAITQTRAGRSKEKRNTVRRLTR